VVEEILEGNLSTYNSVHQQSIHTFL